MTGLQCLLRCGVAAVLTVVVTTTQAASLITHYEFEGGTSNSVGGAPNGTLVDFNPGNPAPSITPGVVGAGSLNLPFGDVMQTTTAGNPTGTDFAAGTIALWIKTAPGLNSGDVANSTIWGNLNQNDSTAFLLGTNGVGNLQLFPRAADGSQARPRVAPGGDVFTYEGSWADGNWRHIAISWENGAANGSTTAQWYIDGQPIDTQVADQALNNTDVFAPWEFEMTIGARNNRGSLDQFLTGGMMLDDIRVYDMALSTAEIRALPGVIPEPATMVLLALGAILGPVRLRR